MSWVLIQYPANFELSSLNGVQLDLDTQDVQQTEVATVLVTPPAAELVFPLKEKSGKLRVAGTFGRSIQVVPNP